MGPRPWPRSPRSLRGRLIAATLVLVAAGLVVADVTTYEFLNSFVLSRVDQQLRSAEPAVDRTLEEITGLGPDFGPAPSGLVVPPGTYGAFLDAAGRVLPRGAVFFGYREQGHELPAPPVLPFNLPGSSGAANTGERLFTAATADGSGVRYRVVAVALEHGPATLVVAIPLTEATGTLHRLLLVEVLVTLGVLAVVAGLALWLVRLGLRPLEQIGATAGAIAAGDLSRRVEPADKQTEVGRLGIALNAMLGQIEESFERQEEAFAQQRAGDARLRRFVADASHELRTPLTSIRGYAELFRRGAAGRPDDLAKAMERIESEAGRMGFLLEDLLALARLDQEAPLSRARMDLATLAARAVQDARAADPDCSITLRGTGPVPVEADEGRLKQVIDNLLANARVHTPPGTAVQVTVAAADRATLEVSDEGPGVPPELGTRIFERFFRADPSRSRGKGGAGLGLAIAAEIARAHGGTLSLVSAGPGSTFRLTLPLATDGSPGS